MYNGNDIPKEIIPIIYVTSDYVQYIQTQIENVLEFYTAGRTIITKEYKHAVVPTSLTVIFGLF